MVRTLIYSILIAACSGCVKYVPTPAPQPTPVPVAKVAPAPIVEEYTPPKDWTMVNEKHYYVSIPKGWKSSDTDDDDEREHRTYSNGDETIRLTVGFEDSEGISLKSYTKLLIDNLAEHEAKILYGRKVEIDNSPAVQMIIQRGRVAFLAHAIVKDGKAYQIGCASSVDDFETMAKVCPDIVSTFKFKKK